MGLRKLLAGSALGALLLMSFAQSAFAALSVEQRLSDYSQLVNVLQRNYAPLRWKETSINLDFPRTVSVFREKVVSAKSDAEFYRVLAQFLSTLKDTHVGASIPSSYRAQLGFMVDLVQGKVLIESVDRLKLPEVLFPFQRCD